MAAPTIVKDIKHPNMFRILWENGTLSDLVNLTWAKEALRRFQETQERHKYAGRKRRIIQSG